MADLRKSGLAFAKAMKQAEGEATAALAADKAARMAQLIESERALPLRLPRAAPKTKQELAAHAERVGRQMLGEHVTSGKKGDTKNLAGRSMKENQRVKELEYELSPTKDIPQSQVYESRIGDINVAFPGDYTLSDVELKSLRGQPVGSRQQGGSRYGLGKMEGDEPLFWASSEMPAQLAQDKITDVAHLFEPDRVMAEHLAMGPVATNFAQHFADANLRAIDYSKLSKKNMNDFDRIIAGGYDKKNPKTGVIETVAFPNWPGIADPEAAYAAMKADPELRKWFNNRMKTPSVTEATNMPNGLDVQWAITSPDLRNMEVNLTGHSVGEMVPGAKLTDTAEHETYSKGIRGKYKGHQGVLTPFQISYPDAAQHIATTQRPQDFTGTIQKVFPHQIVDQQYLDEYGEYERQLQKLLTGKKKGGTVNREEYQAKLDAMMEKHMAEGGGAFKKMQFKAEGGTIDNTVPDNSDGGQIMFAPKYASGGAIHHGIKPLQWKAGGGWMKAGKAIAKAAQEAGAMKAPQTAEKDLTTLQDFHTSLGDKVRARAMEAQKQMDSWDYKYDKGQHVFTEHGAKNNLPPLKILERSRTGNAVMREDMNDPFSKKIIDPETGRAKRTPYEPGYKVRREFSPDEWSEFIIPESAIKGDVEMAGGGLSRAAKAIAKASAEAEAAMPAVNRIDMNYKDVTKRVPELTEAAQKVATGDMSPAEYDALVNKVKPVMPYGFVPAPATTDDAMRALTENKRPMFGKTNEMSAGEQADLRLDIPAYKDHGVWVNSIHRKDAPTVYGSTSAVKNATMIGAPEKAMRVATGETAKAPFAVIRGEWNPMDEATAVKNAQKYLKHKDWRQVGYDPERHGYFYDRHTMEPIEGAEEVIQIGPLVLAKKPRYGKKDEQKFDGGGLAVDQSNMGDDSPSKTRLMMEILARMAKEQGKEEIASLKKPRSVTDLANRGIVAPLAGAPVDIVNMGLEGIDFLREKATGKPVENRLASDKPFLGSEHLKDVMKQYGMTTDEERPMMETGLSLFSPSAAGAAKGVAKTGEAVSKGVRAGEAGLNAATAAMRRPFTPATVTAEAVAPDLAKYKPRQWQETVTRRMTGEGAPVSMETMGGRKTTKRAGQGVYENFEGQLETNPLVTADVPFAGNLSTNKALRADISQAGQDLAQESMAAHRFVPMATNQIKDASAMLIKTPDGLTNEQVIALGERLPGMIVAHNPRLGGVVVMPYEVQKGIQPEFLDAQSVAQSVLGKKAKFQYGKADPAKDRLYIERGDYATEGAKPSSRESIAMRERLKRGEGRMFPAQRQSRSGLGQVRESLATTAD